MIDSCKLSGKRSAQPTTPSLSIWQAVVQWWDVRRVRRYHGDGEYHAASHQGTLQASGEGGCVPHASGELAKLREADTWSERLKKVGWDEVYV